MSIIYFNEFELIIALILFIFFFYFHLSSNLSPYSTLADWVNIHAQSGLRIRIPKPIYFQVVFRTASVKNILNFCICGPGGKGLSAGCGEHPVLAGGPGL